MGQAGGPAPPLDLEAPRGVCRERSVRGLGLGAHGMAGRSAESSGGAIVLPPGRPVSLRTGHQIQFCAPAPSCPSLCPRPLMPLPMPTPPHAMPLPIPHPPCPYPCPYPCPSTSPSPPPCPPHALPMPSPHAPPPPPSPCPPYHQHTTTRGTPQCVRASRHHPWCPVGPERVCGSLTVTPALTSACCAP